MKKDRNYENITEKEWKEVYDKTEKKIRKTAKTIAVIVAVIFIIIAVFWVSIVYVRDYKVTEAATSESPDGKYELILQAVGEAEWPFGSADGRIVLMEGNGRYQKLVLPFTMTAVTCGKAYGRLRGMRTLWRLFCPGTSSRMSRFFCILTGRREDSCRIPETILMREQNLRQYFHSPMSNI